MCVGLILFAATLWAYNRSSLKFFPRMLCVGLKIIGMGLLVVCWLEPQWIQRVPRAKANLVAVLLDDSLSMRLPDGTQGLSRGAHLREVWNQGASTWRAELERSFRVRNFAFADGLLELPQNPEFRWEGSSSSLGGALSQLQDRVGEKPAGIVVCTDGVVAGLSELDAKLLPPIYPVVFGGAVQKPDLALGMVSATQSAFEDAPVTVAAEVRATGVSGVKARVYIEDLNSEVSGKPGSGVLCETVVKVQRGEERASVQLQFKPTRSGATFYKVRAESADVPAEKELTLENNTRLLCVNRSRGPHRLLYVSGRPNWDFGPMRRALEADPEMRLLGLIRVAKREPKFAFKGQAGESSNPLYRGFQKGDAMDVERYDKPVLVRVNVEAAEQLAGGFPKSEEELFAFKGVILDDLEAEFFTSEQQRLLQRFVAERGGGVLMLGGMESFEGGAWKGTPMEAVLPVWLGKTPENTGAYQWQLSREGLLEPWVRSRPSEAEEIKRAKELPSFEVLNAVAGIKPAASVLAWGINGQEKRPALVTQRYGAGRSAALLAGDFYRWGLGNAARGKDLAKFWRQIARWLVADVPSLVELTMKQDAGKVVETLLVRVRDAKARAVEDAEVDIQVRGLGEDESAAVVLRAEATPQVGTYSVEYPAGNRGALIGVATARTSSGEVLGRSEFGWVQDSVAEEFKTVSSDAKAMKDLAQKTGGEVLSVEGLGALAAKLNNNSNAATEVRMTPLWHTATVFVLALACFCAEWVIRRVNGAP
jgi:uncharacterized membrane protein